MRLKLLLFSLFVLASTTALVFAQTNRGGISGNVTDQSGAVIPSASVVIVNAGTNETRRLTTSDKGSFIVENLDPVTYRIEVSAPGFKKEWNDLVSSFGTLTGFRVIGTVPIGQRCRSVAELRFAGLRTPVDMVFTWATASGALVGSIPREETRPIVLPVGWRDASSAAAIDPFNPKISFALTLASGRLTALRAASGASRTIAP